MPKLHLECKLIDDDGKTELFFSRQALDLEDALKAKHPLAEWLHLTAVGLRVHATANEGKPFDEQVNTELKIQK